MPNRMIKDGIKRNEQINELSWFEEVVFYRLILTADDFGCLDGRSILLKNELFPLKDNVTKKAVEDAIDKLASVGLLCKYTVNGKPYLFFPTWGKHQRLRNRYRKYPEPPVCGLSDTCPSNDGQTTANCRLEVEVEEVEGEKEKNIQEKKALRFVPPTLDEVTEYAKQRKSNVDPKAFFEYFDEGKWVDSEGKPVRNWKQKFLTWERMGNGRTRSQNSNSRQMAKRSEDYRGESFFDK